jgi:hypothetical protein
MYGNCTSACCNYTGGCSGCLTCNPPPKPKPISQGWECPRCHVVYAPWMARCTRCAGNIVLRRDTAPEVPAPFEPEDYPLHPPFEIGSGSVTVTADPTIRVWYGP